VVSVSVNHRLNILGTLDLGAYGSQYANSRYSGTADLVAALQWVHDNIEAFGGDPATSRSSASRAAAARSFG